MAGARLDIRAHREERVVRRGPQPAHRLVIDIEPHGAADADLADARHHPLAGRVARRLHASGQLAQCG